MEMQGIKNGQNNTEKEKGGRINTADFCQVRWLTPIIPALWEARWVDHLRSGVRDQSGQHGETPSLLKIEKLAGYGGTCL